MADQKRTSGDDDRRDIPEGGKSKWMSKSDSPADGPLTDAEKRGLDLLGRGSVRDGAISGVSDETTADKDEERAAE
ncbi:MAG: hypothetical protein ABJD07_16580 [Gemmatimonadaceae bacterium]